MGSKNLLFYIENTAVKYYCILFLYIYKTLINAFSVFPVKLWMGKCWLLCKCSTALRDQQHQNSTTWMQFIYHKTNKQTKNTTIKKGNLQFLQNKTFLFQVKNIYDCEGILYKGYKAVNLKSQKIAALTLMLHFLLPRRPLKPRTEPWPKHTVLGILREKSTAAQFWASDCLVLNAKKTVVHMCCNQYFTHI